MVVQQALVQVVGVLWQWNNKLKMKKITGEFIEIYFLVLCGCGAIVIGQVSNGAVTPAGIAITLGLVVMSLIYALGDEAGAHLNPAVSIAFTLAKKISCIVPSSLYHQPVGWGDCCRIDFKNAVSSQLAFRSNHPCWFKYSIFYS